MNASRPWFDLAEDDRRMAELALREGIQNMACFHSQQAVEKALKGLLVERRGRFPKVHALPELLTLCAETDPGMMVFEVDIATLDRYYVPTRYPVAPPGSLPGGAPDVRDAQEAVAMMQAILQFVRSQAGIAGEPGGAR